MSCAFFSKLSFLKKLHYPLLGHFDKFIRTSLLDLFRNSTIPIRTHPSTSSGRTGFHTVRVFSVRGELVEPFERFVIKDYRLRMIFSEEIYLQKATHSFLFLAILNLCK